MKIRHLKRASTARTLKRIAHAPVRQALMEQGRRAGYFALEQRNQRRQKRRFRKAARFFGGHRWPASVIDSLALRTKAAGCKPLTFNHIKFDLQLCNEVEIP